MSTTSFASFLVAARAAASLTQASVDTYMEWSKGYTAQLENGRLKPPDKASCERLDLLFRQRPGTTWDAAKLDRLERMDADLAAEWRRMVLARAVQGASTVSSEEQRLVVALRQLDHLMPAADTGTSVVEDAADAVEDLVELCEDARTRAQVVACSSHLRAFGVMLPANQLAFLQAAGWTARLALGVGDESAGADDVVIPSPPPPGADDVLAFVAARCSVEADARARGPELYQTYRAWRETGDERPVPSPKAFAVALRDAGFRPRRTTHGTRIWVGLKII